MGFRIGSNRILRRLLSLSTVWILLSGCAQQDKVIDLSSQLGTKKAIDPISEKDANRLESEFIKVDQFGYLPSAQKIAVITDPQTGFFGTQTFSPGTATDKYHVCKWINDECVHNGTLVQWNGGATHEQSGDKVWHYDFSTLVTPGEYYIWDATNNAISEKFTIGDTVYQDVLKTAMRTFYYQRSGLAKTAAFAGADYVDTASHEGALQDTHSRFYDEKTSTAKELNMKGGWYDAGDYNKYVNFAWLAVLDLLLAYEENPNAWDKDYNIPESATNTIPDILDEVKYELDWLLRMQDATTGGISSMVGVEGYATASPPSADTAQRFYGKRTTSATLSGAAMFALGAIQFKAAAKHPGVSAADATILTAYSTTLQTAAVRAWGWATDTRYDDITFYNSGKIGSGEQEDPADKYAEYIKIRKLVAASYLFALTKDSTYATFIDANFATILSASEIRMYLPYAQLQDALLYYAKTSGATAAKRTTIYNTYIADIGEGQYLPKFTNKDDAYRAYLPYYNWGSNRFKSRVGNMFLVMNALGLKRDSAAEYKKAASGYLHYLHGVNPLRKVYLTNMSLKGATNSVYTMYHSWFKYGTKWGKLDKTVGNPGPAPGYLVGGPNSDYTRTRTDLTSRYFWDLLLSQPAQKKYADFNTPGTASYELTENAIYYQAAYVRMLSKFYKPSHKIIAVAGANGTIAATGKTIATDGTVRVNEGTNQTFTVTASSGYQIDKIFINGNKIPITSTSSMSYTFASVNTTHVITATFHNPAAHWKFDEGTGLEASNSKPFSAAITGDGILMSYSSAANKTYPSWTTATNQLGDVISFDGADDYINMGNVLNPVNSSFTYSMWFRWDGKTDENALINKDGQYGAAVFGINTSTGYVRFAFKGSWVWRGDNTFQVASGTWYHLTVVYDRTNKQHRMYKNGLLVSTTTFTSALPDIGTGTGKRFLVGARSIENPTFEFATGSFFKGAIDEVRAYWGVLTVAQIKDLP